MTKAYKNTAEQAVPSKRIRLNKLISNAGVCVRRVADTLIQTGQITVNGKLITTLGYKVTPQDVVKYRGQVLQARKPVYILLNKPKDYITTNQDPQGRKTVWKLSSMLAQNGFIL